MRSPHRHEQLTHEYTLQHARRIHPGHIRAGDRAMFRGPDYRAIENARYHGKPYRPSLRVQFKVLYRMVQVMATITALVSIALYAAH